MKIDPLTQIDFYKADHRRQYPDGTSLVYSNFTPRSFRLGEGIVKYTNEKCVFFGLQGFVKWFLQDCWNEEFFNKPKNEVVARYKRRMDNALGKDTIPVDHIEALHDLGYLPIKIRALPEGTMVKAKVPVFTVENTIDEFFWLTNYLESVMSAELWKSCVASTIAKAYRNLLNQYAKETGGNTDIIPLQGHDFSYRGMSGAHDGMSTGAGHLTSFVGTDTVSAIDFLENYYNANSDNELIGCSVPATEHSVMCLNAEYDGEEPNELESFRRLITELYPSGIVSIVSDSFDFWRVMSEYTRQLKDEIVNRTPNSLGLAKVVFRPDSGDPVEIICGDLDAPEGSPERKGAMECLWEVFGGTVNDKGYKELHPSVGLIYGDSITIERCYSILEGLKQKGFASTNIVFGIGSFTYQYLTRDTFGYAMKATYGVVDGKGRAIYKEPKTDSGTKKSAKGLIRVDYDENGEITLFDNQSSVQSEGGLLDTVFLDGRIVRETTLAEVRQRLESF